MNDLHSPHTHDGSYFHSIRYQFLPDNKGTSSDTTHRGTHQVKNEKLSDQRLYRVNHMVLLSPLSSCRSPGTRSVSETAYERWTTLRGERYEDGGCITFLEFPSFVSWLRVVIMPTGGSVSDSRSEAACGLLPPVAWDGWRIWNTGDDNSFQEAEISKWITIFFTSGIRTSIDFLFIILPYGSDPGLHQLLSTYQ